MKGSIYKTKYGYQVRFGRKLTKHFKSKTEAERFLNGIRFKTDEGSYDIRDYKKVNPLSIEKLVSDYISHKEKTEIGKTQITHIERVLSLFAAKVGLKTSIKAIGEAEIEDFLFSDSLKIGNKTRHNYKSALSDFFRWVVRREKRLSGIEMPEFPDISFKLGWRNIVDVETQQRIIEEIYRISFDENPRIWLGIKLLNLYPKIRPGEMLSLQEGHINLNERWLLFPRPKEQEPKFVHILQEHCDLIESLWSPRGLPHMYFFRHLRTKSGINAGIQFGPKYFAKWWDKACKNIGVTGVSLYPGTKHSTVTALGKKLTPEQIQRSGTGHVSEAFKRYMLPDVNEATIVSQAVVDMQNSNQHLINISDHSKKSK